MALSKRFEKDLKTHAKTRARLNRRGEVEIKRASTQYHRWYADQVDQGNNPPRILAEGDSWFLYIVGRAVISHLEQKLNGEILNLASPGDEVGGMMTGKQRARLVSELKNGAAPGKKFEYFLFSGGGNDLVGADTFYKWLNPWKPGTSNLKKTINWTAFNAMLEILKIGYLDAINIRDKHSPKTTLVFHGYDFAIPNGKGVCGLGPWLEPGLVERKIPRKHREEVVKIFLTHLNQWQKELAANSKNVIVVPTQGTLSKKEWANELHPTNSGFSKIANKFMFALFGKGAPGEGRVDLLPSGRVRRRVKRASSSIQ